MPINDWNNPICWLSSIILKGKVKPIDIILALENENIESRPLWKPMHIQPYFKKYDYIGESNSDYLFEKGLCLPSDTKITDDQLKQIVNIIRGLFGNA
jgi:dTDP-4-amino-4,6-dideoxygalactose transaminase